MATLNELTFNLLDMARGGVLSDDENISYMQVQFWIHNARSLFIRQDIQKGRTLSSNILQMLPCLDVIIVDASTCPCQVPIGCTILRTKNKIPKPIETDMKDLITQIAPIGMLDRPYTLINPARARFVGFNKFSKTNPKAFYANGYIWIINSTPIEKITVHGVFENPTDLRDYQDCNNQSCYSDEMEYPISSWMIPMLEAYIMEKNFKIILGAPIDNTGNAKTDVEPTSQK